MSELTALEKFACPACGAQAEWSAGKMMLVCPFCGTQSPAQLDADSGKVVEHDLARALREAPEEWRGWDTVRKTVKCQSCQAITVFDAARIGQNCDFCGSPSLIDYAEVNPPIRPESVLPFLVDRETVQAVVRRWLGGHWLAPNDLNRRGLVDTIRGLYIPYWTFDSSVTCPWEAESGDYYYETKWVTDSHGNRRSVSVRKTHWYPTSGSVSHEFDDHLVPGSRGISAKLLRQIEPFPTTGLLPYDPGYVSGWDIEHYQVVLLEAAQQAREEKTQILQRIASQAVPGDTHRNLQVYPDFSRETFKHILVPVWLLAYNYGASTFQIVINGVTGMIAGKFPLSAWKIFFLCVAAVVLVLVILLVASTSQ